jgi:hypothetical protein
VRWALALAAAAALAAAGASAAAAPTLTFASFAHTDLPLGQVVWTGTSFLYLAENLPQVETADASGANVHLFATIPGGLGGEEIRCAVPVIAYWPDGIYCHTPDNRIFRIARDGSSLTQLARLPGGPSDGGLVFDSTGKFGYALLASTGGSASSGGDVYAVRRDGRVQHIGSYPGTGGADSLAMAPGQFGRASGLLLLSIDQDSVSGRVLAIDRKGNVQVVASGLGNGDNPIVAIPPAPKTRPAGSAAAPGLYIPNTNTMDVYFAPAAQLVPYAGQVLVGTELGGSFWLIRPSASGFATEPVAVQLPTGDLNLEGAAYVP